MLSISVLSFLFYDIPYILYRINIWALWLPLQNNYPFFFMKTLHSFSSVVRRVVLREYWSFNCAFA